MVNKVHKRLLDNRTEEMDMIYNRMEKTDFSARAELIRFCQKRRCQYEEVFKLLEDDMLNMTPENISINNDENIENIENEILDIKKCFSENKKYFKVEFADSIVEIKQNEIDKFGLSLDDKFTIAIIVNYLHKDIA